MLTKNILRSLWSILSHLHLTTNKLLHLDHFFIASNIWILSDSITNGFGESFGKEEIIGSFCCCFVDQLFDIPFQYIDF
jgi:hypothetical protein